MTEREFWNEAYQHDPEHTSVPNRFLPHVVAELPAGSVLDVGCGAGENAMYLARNGWHVTGIDWSDHAVFLAERAAFAAGVQARFFVADAAEWNVKRRFDLVVIMYALPAGGRGARVIRNAARLVRPGGTLFVADWDRSMAEPWGFDPCELHDPQAIAEIVPEFQIREATVYRHKDLFARNDPRAHHGRWVNTAVVHAVRGDPAGESPDFV